MNSSHLQLSQHNYRYFILCVALLLFAGILSLQGLKDISDQIKQDLKSKLQTVLVTTHETMKGWFYERITKARQFVSRPDIIQLVQEQLNLYKTGQTLVGSTPLEKLRMTIRPLLEDHKDLGFFVISPDLISIASMRDQNIGTMNLLAQEGNYLKNIFEGELQLVLPVRSDVPLPVSADKMMEDESTMFIGVPVLDDSGVVIAAFTIRVNPHLDFTRFAQIARTGETGDSYAFNKNERVITEVRFIEDLRRVGLIKPGEGTILNLRVSDPGGNMLKGFRPNMEREKLPLTRMAKSAISGKDGLDVEGYRDYRGVPVVGAWLWDDEYNFGLTFEIDVAEAYQSFYRIRSIVVNVLSISIVMFLGLSLALLRRNRKILSLAKGLRDSESEMRAVLETAPCGIISININGIIQRINPAGEIMFGYRANEIIGTNITILMPESYRAKHMHSMNNYVTTGVKNVMGKHVEVEGLRKDGSMFPVELSVAEMWMGKNRFFTGILQDITERKIMENKLIEISQTDGLTGLFNRRHFDEVLQSEWKRALRAHSQISLIMIDIDFFKPFNDNYGHQAGDKCLQRVSKTIGQFANRPADLLARYGGEELAVILPNTSSENAYEMAEQMRKAVEELKIPHRGSTVRDYNFVSISSGIAMLTPGANSTQADLIKRADEALYKAKAQGRNQTVGSHMNINSR